MIKIAYIIDTIESPTAGTEKQLLMLIKHLDRSRFQPYLCVLRTSEWLENEFDLCPLFVANIHSFKSPKGLMAVLALAGFLKKKQFDVVQTHFRDASMAGITASRLAGVKAIIGTRRNQGYWMTSFDRTIQKLLDKWVSCYIANSQSTKQWQIATEGISDEKIHVINNGFDFNSNQQNMYECRRTTRISLGVAGHASVITIVANLREVKDHVTFLKAAQFVHASCSDCIFWIVGEGGNLDSLKTMTFELGLLEVVKFLGVRRDIPEILAASDIGVLSSRSESFSNALVEYMSAGLPVVSTDVGGASEAIENGENGYIVPVGDWQELGNSILRILHSDKKAVMGQASLKISKERFSLPVMIERTEHLYASVQIEL